MFWWRSIKDITNADESPALVNGSIYHEVIASYRKAIMNGNNFEDSVAVALIKLSSLMSKITSDNPKYTTSVAIDTLTDYFIRWKDEQVKYIMVEVGGAIELNSFVYAFRIDGIGETPFGLSIIETKTTSIVGERWHKRGKPNLQLDGYMFGASSLIDKDILLATLDIIPIHENNKSRKPSFRIPTERSHKDMEVWHKNIEHWFSDIKNCEKNNFYPMNTEQCVPLIGFECDYQLLCKMYPFAYEMETIDIPAEYKVEKWEPWDLD
jgi:hypothetical protein